MMLLRMQMSLVYDAMTQYIKNEICIYCEYLSQRKEGTNLTRAVALNGHIFLTLSTKLYSN